MSMDEERVYLVIGLSSLHPQREYVEAIFRDSQAADEFKEMREQSYAQMTDNPPRFRIDERVLR